MTGSAVATTWLSSDTMNDTTEVRASTQRGPLSLGSPSPPLLAPLLVQTPAGRKLSDDFPADRGPYGWREWCAAMDTVLDRARAGDDGAFGELTDPFLGELRLHCYRILGSVQDAEDVLQETLLAAWRGLGGFEERASLRTWLYRIATNRCLNALRATARGRGRAARAFVGGRADSPRRAVVAFPFPGCAAGRSAGSGRRPGGTVRGAGDDRPGVRRGGAEAAAAPTCGPGAPGRAGLPVFGGGGHARGQRGFGEQRAAAGPGTMERSLPGPDRERAPLPRSLKEREVASRFAVAFAGGDVDGVVSLLTDDAWFTMPPVTLEYQGPVAIAAFLRSIAGWRGRRRYRLIPTRANGQPAYGFYVQEPSGTVSSGTGRSC